MSPSKVFLEEDLPLFDGYKRPRQSYSGATEEQLPTCDDFGGLRQSCTELGPESSTMVNANIAPTVVVEGQHASDASSTASVAQPSIAMEVTSTPRLLA